MLDPPRFGRGPDGELWKLDESLPELLAVCARLLSESPVFVLLNVYATVLTAGRIEKEAEQLRRYLGEMLPKSQVTITAGELATEDAAHRRVSSSVFALAEAKML